MPTARRFGSPGQGQIECRHSPPAPGFHFGRSGTSHSACTRAQLLPPSPLRNSAAGATPHHSSPSATPGSITQMRSTAALAPAGKAGPSACCHFAGGIVGVEEVRAELAVRDAGEIAAAARDRAWRTPPPRPGRRARRSRAGRRASRAGRRGPSSCRRAVRSCLILQRLRRRCAARRPARSAHRAKRPRRRRNSFTWRRSAPCSSTTQPRSAG